MAFQNRYHVPGYQLFPRVPYEQNKEGYICFYATICIKSKNAFKAFSPHFSNRDTFTIQRLYIVNSFETLESTCHVALLTTGHCEKVGTMDTLKSGWTLPVSIHSPILKVKNRSMGIIN